MSIEEHDFRTQVPLPELKTFGVTSTSSPQKLDYLETPQGDTVVGEPSSETLHAHLSPEEQFKREQYRKMFDAANEDGNIHVFRVTYEKPDGTVAEEHITVAPDEHRALYFETTGTLPTMDNVYLYIKKWDIPAEPARPRFALDRLKTKSDNDIRNVETCLSQEHCKYMNRTNTVHLRRIDDLTREELKKQGHERISIAQFEQRILLAPSNPRTITDIELIANVYRLKLRLFSQASDYENVPQHLIDDLDKTLPFTKVTAMKESKWFKVIDNVVIPNTVAILGPGGKIKAYDLPYEVLCYVVDQYGNVYLNGEVTPQNVNGWAWVDSGGSTSVPYSPEGNMLLEEYDMIELAEKSGLAEAEQELNMTADVETEFSKQQKYYDEREKKEKTRTLKKRVRNRVFLLTAESSDRVKSKTHIVLIRNARPLTAAEKVIANEKANEQHAVRRGVFTERQLRKAIKDHQIIDARTVASQYIYEVFRAWEQKLDVVDKFLALSRDTVKEGTAPFKPETLDEENTAALREASPKRVKLKE